MPLKRRIPRFRLHESQEAVNRAGTLITIRVERADGLKPGTAIRFRGLDVGSIESVDLTSDLQAVLLRARITQAADRIARAGTQFWVVKPALGLVRTENLDTLVVGSTWKCSRRSRTGAAA
jgi:paraquat-inducible protein B